jgi:hypothetical protein
LQEAQALKIFGSFCPKSNEFKRTLFGADIDEMGIEVAHFDKEIDEMNHLYNEMTVTLPFAYVD